MARTHQPNRLALACLALFVSGCGSPAERFIRRMDALPPEERVPNWEMTKALINRPAPPVGSTAPDFTLKDPGGTRTITRSVFQGNRPLVLIFGSFT